MARTVSATLAMIVMSYMAIPHIVSAIADNSKLQHQLQLQSVELSEAKAEINQLRYRAMQPGMLTEDDAPRMPQRGHRPPLVGTAPLPDAVTAAAAAFTNPQCREEWLARRRRDAAPSALQSAHPEPLPFAGGNLAVPGVLEAALEARAPAKELIFLSVGDTRDHRREIKDPALRTISVDFLLNLLANLKQLGIGHYLILTTEPLCRKLQQEHCEAACVWTELWHDHPGLEPWGLKPGDMFLMWAQQWRYICRAMELGYRVLRADTDVYLAEDPYPLLRGPLFSQFQMVVQHDVEGRNKPRCDHDKAPAARSPNQGNHAQHLALASCGVRDRGSALLNIGLVYLRSAPGGGVFGVINGTWARFLQRLSEAPFRPPHLNGKVETQALIDQPFMREVVHDLALPDRAATPPKPAQSWSVVPGSAAALYPLGVQCALRNAAACAAVGRQRAASAFLSQLVRPSMPGNRGASMPREERIALAPDWLFGRGCLTHVRKPLELLRRIEASCNAPEATCTAPGLETTCTAPPRQRGFSTPAPGPAAGLLVATHFVYSMALKRKRAFRAFGWDLGDARNRSAAPTDSCWRRTDRAMLFGHTAFTDTPETKSVLCALPRGDEPDCTCCTGLPSIKGPVGRSVQLETTGGAAIHNNMVVEKLEGCNDYQLYWD